MAEQQKQELNDTVFEQFMRCLNARQFGPEKMKRYASQQHWQELINAINDYGYNEVLHFVNLTLNQGDN